MDITIATYNSGKTLRQCLESIVREIPNPRIIVVDRYSTDKTIEIAKEFNCEIYYEDLGLGYARQLSFSKCSSEWIAIISSDNVLSEGWYENMIKFIKDDVGAIECFPRLTCLGDYVVELYRKTYPKAFENMEIYRDLQKGERGIIDAVLIRRSLIEDLKIPSHIKSTEDIIISNHILQKGYRWVRTPVLSDHICTITHGMKKARWIGAGHRKETKDTLLDVVSTLYQSSIMGVLECVRGWGLAPIIFRIIFQINFMIGYLFADKYHDMKR